MWGGFVPIFAGNFDAISGTYSCPRPTPKGATSYHDQSLGEHKAPHSATNFSSLKPATPLLRDEGIAGRATQQADHLRGSA
ncbi:hypothetical protein DENSPDRAFT_208026 [Dentipellis sp. KUC8613]|nr:hypothetical protein DENSPDRAFT_208026 [Dentipellis sp. KUC8613]